MPEPERRAEMLRDVTYVAIGAAVLGVQRTMVVRRRLAEASEGLVSQAAITSDLAFDVIESLLPDPARGQVALARRRVRWAVRATRTVLGLSVDKRGPAPAEAPADAPDSSR